MHSIPHNTQIALKRPYADFSGEFGLPNALRERLLQLGLGESALILDALIYAGAKQHRAYTLRQLVDLLRKSGFQMSEGLIYRGLQAYFFPKDWLVKGVGHPIKRYYMPFIQKLLDTYALGKPLLSDNFHAGDFDSLTLYRRALHRELIARRPREYSRKFLSQRLGVSERTTWNYDRAVGIQVEQRFKRQKIYYQVWGWEGDIRAAKPGKQWLEAFYWRTEETKRIPANIHAARWARQHGAELTLVTQQTNHYSISSEYLNATQSRLPY